MINSNFMESIRLVPDKENEMLLKIQKELEIEGITAENVLELTKKLSDSQKQKLKLLYINQIENLNSKTELCRIKILKIKKNIKKSVP